MEDLKLCFICGGRNSYSINCKTCSQSCCQLCISLHKTPSICRLISKYGSHLSETCEIHDGLKCCFFCLQCLTKTCKECYASHSNHTILKLETAVKKIKETFQKHKLCLEAKENDAKTVIEETPRKHKELMETGRKIENEVTKWDDSIFRIANELQITLTDDRVKIENIAEKTQDSRKEINDAMQNLVMMENINFELTFLAVWSGFSKELTMLGKNEVMLGSPKKKTFKPNLSDISEIRKLFGYLQSEGTECDSSETLTPEKTTIPGPTMTDEIDQLSQDFSQTVTITDETEKKKHLKHERIMHAKQALENKVTKLENEIKDTLISKQKQQKQLLEREAIEMDQLKLEAEVEKYSRKTKELSTENKAMEESVRGLLDYVIRMRSTPDTRLLNNVNTVPEIFEFVRNQIAEMNQSLSKHVNLQNEKDRVQAELQSKDGEKRPTKTQDEYDSLVNQKENLESQVLEMNIKVKEISMANQELIVKQSEMQTLLWESVVKPNILTRECNVTLEEDAKSLPDVVSLILNHITKLNESLNELENQLQDEKSKTYELMNKQTDQDEKKKYFMQEHQNKLVMLESELKSKETMLNEHKASMLESDQKLKDLQGQLYKSLQEKKKTDETYHNACKQINDLQQGTKSVQMVLDDNEKSMADMTRTIENMSRSLKEKENEVTVEKQKNNERAQREEKLHHKIIRQNKVISDIDHKLRQQKVIITDQEEKIILVRAEKDDLQTRLSSIAGEKLTKGNPAITDLGDPNRPMKIGEKYGELYDNEWTDAMENTRNVKKYYPEMTDGEIEEIIIRHLQRLLKCCYKECLTKAEDQIQTLGEALAETMFLTFKSV
ncbi:unnamed protein product [Mytilus coruscus]|uniref:B box-type domain-containing protein n=1 Tax=Mytilus coruscus TaxID=42192 RepID=A0A6J8E9G2_MYTCO|nr:unnamed protein product [Mytilus coruscus]